MCITDIYLSLFFGVIQKQLEGNGCSVISLRKDFPHWAMCCRLCLCRGSCWTFTTRQIDWIPMSSGLFLLSGDFSTKTMPKRNIQVLILHYVCLLFHLPLLIAVQYINRWWCGDMAQLLSFSVFKGCITVTWCKKCSPLWTVSRAGLWISLSVAAAVLASTVQGRASSPSLDPACQVRNRTDDLS